jgi:nucleotide-binding universal stress UspA family protein
MMIKHGLESEMGMNAPPYSLTENPVFEQGEFLVLLPVLDVDETQRLLPLALAVAQWHAGVVMMLGIVVVPESQPLSDGMLETRRLRAALDGLVASVQGQDAIRIAVNVARSQVEAIRTAAWEQKANLILMGLPANQSSPERLFGSPIEDVLLEAPCDVVVARLQRETPWQRLLLPVRGGPHTRLARETAQALAEYYDATVSLLYASDRGFADDAETRKRVQALRDLPRFTDWRELSLPPEQAIVAEAASHQVVVLGVTGRRGDPEAPVGPIANAVLHNVECSVILVKHHLAQDEEQAVQRWQRQLDASAAVDRWFAENTFSSSEFEGLQELVALKQQQGVTISLALPTLDEEETIGEIIEIVQRTLVEEVPLLDEIVLIDSNSQDRTRDIARDYGLPVHIHQEILPEYGAFAGKGEALWKSLYVLKGDIIAWTDTDIRNFHPRFVYGIIGPLLRQPRLVYSKGFYRRPLQQGITLSSEGGGRVTELTARPLLNLFYPALSGMLQPLSGEYAGRRSALEQVPFFTGYGVETGLLIDLLEQHGLSALAQVDLQQRIHRNQGLQPLSKMAFAIIQVILQRMEEQQHVQLLRPANQSMKLIHYIEDEGFQLEVREIRDHERPPMASIPEYQRRVIDDRR